MDKILVEIERHIGVLQTRPNGWRKELNIVSWNNEKAKYDIREWSPDHTRMSRGITLTEEEFANLMQCGSKELEGASK